MTAHVTRLPFSLDPLMAEAKRRTRQRRTLFLLAVLLIGLATGLTLALRSPGGPTSGRSGLVAARYPHGGVSFRRPATWTRVTCAPGIVLTTANPVQGCPQPVAAIAALWPKEPLGANGVTLQILAVPLSVFDVPGAKRPRWDERIAGQTAWAARPIYDWNTWQSCPAAVRGKDYFTVIRSPLDGSRAITARAVICGPNLAAGRATVTRVLDSLRFTRSS